MMNCYQTESPELKVDGAVCNGYICKQHVLLSTTAHSKQICWLNVRYSIK